MPVSQQTEFADVGVALGARAYRVLIGPGLIDQAGQLITAYIGKGRFFIVTDAHVADAHLEALTDSLGADCILGQRVLPAGEATKRFALLQETCEDILKAGVERGDLVVALGGGVIGDLAGFAAAIVRRGVRFVQIPTSLLAQVDSSVGGKTGINTPQGKNLVGAFHQPGLVLADTGALATLPARQMRAGYAEVVKYGLLGDPAFYTWLEDNARAVLEQDRNAVLYAVQRSVEMKAEIVARDETEQSDRALLNLGHTFGHALEAWMGYGDGLLHGEGVAIGMNLAFRMSERKGYCAPQTAARVAAHLKSAGLPTRIQDISSGAPADPDELVRLMEQDKKVRDGQLTFIMARSIGDAFITRDISKAEVVEFLKEELM